MSPRRFRFFYGWVIVVVATLGVGASIPGQTMGMGVFTEALIGALALERVDISLAYLLGTVASGLLLPLGGRMLDRWGARRVAVLAAVAMGAALFFMAHCDRIARAAASAAGGLLPAEHAAWLTAFVTVSFGFFLIRFWGQGMLTISSRNMIGKWFNHRRGLAVGISGVATALLFSAAPAILDFWVQRLGWRGTWMAIGLVLLLGISVIAWAFFRDNPEECGLTMDGDYKPPAVVKENLDLKIHRDLTRGEALRTYSFWVFNLSFAWHALFGTAYTFHVLSIGESIGLDHSAILRLFLYAAFFAICSNMFSGWISARVRVKHLLVVMNAAVILFAAAPLVADPMLAKAGIVLGMGIAGGLWGNLSGLVFPRFFGRRHLGAISGVFMATTVFASAVGPWVFSLLEAAHGDYRLAFALSAILPTTLMLAAFRADNPQRPPAR